MSERTTEPPTTPDWTKQGPYWRGRCYACVFERGTASDLLRSQCSAFDAHAAPWSIELAFDDIAASAGRIDWPSSFMPIWLRFCDAFQAKEDQ